MDTSTFEKEVRAYVSQALPRGSRYEHEKLVRDWLDKAHTGAVFARACDTSFGPLRGKTVLDIGFGNGQFLEAFASLGAIVHGVEVEPKLHAFAKAHTAALVPPDALMLYDGRTFPYADRSMDFIYSLSVLEHTDDPARVLQEAARVLKPGGIFYLSFPNKWRVKDPHTGIWFLGYVPRSIASFLLRVSHRSPLADWNLHFLDFFDLRIMLATHHIPLHIRFHTEGTGPRAMLRRFLAHFGIHHSALLGQIMVPLEKRDTQ